MDAREADLYGPRVLALLTAGEDDAGREVRRRRSPSRSSSRSSRSRRTSPSARSACPGPTGSWASASAASSRPTAPPRRASTPSNWEAVLWHEFCHMVTLHKTHNKMPRWLSEGISVYEERQEDPAWGQAMTPQYREMILGDELTPLSQLSAAFLAPKSPLHLQFAYLRVVAGGRVPRATGTASPALKGVLDDLGAGMPINEALARADRHVARAAGSGLRRVRASDRPKPSAPDATWEEPDLPADADSAARRGLARDASEELLGAASGLAARLVARGEVAARPRRPCASSRRSYPDYVGPENAYVLLAAVHRRLSEAGRGARGPGRAGRRATATRPPAYLRLMELAEAAGDWAAVGQERAPAAGGQPADPRPAPPARPGRRSSWASATRRSPPTAPSPCSTPPDPAEVHYRLARLLRPGRQAGRGPPRGAQGPGGGPALPRRPPAAARTGRTRAADATPPTSAAGPAPRRPAMTRRRLTRWPRSRASLALACGVTPGPAAAAGRRPRSTAAPRRPRRRARTGRSTSGSRTTSSPSSAIEYDSLRRRRRRRGGAAAGRPTTPTAT